MVHSNFKLHGSEIAAGFFIVETGFLDKTKDFKIKQKLESMKEPKNVYNA